MTAQLHKLPKDDNLGKGALFYNEILKKMVSKQKITLTHVAKNIRRYGAVVDITYCCEAHHEMRSLCGAVSTVDPARETALCASRADSPNASSTEMASIAVRPTPPAQ